MFILKIMDGFNREKVLEQLIRDAPTLSNRRKLVKGRKGKVMVYAFYNNCGTPDPAFNFHRLKTPVETNRNDSLCEVYSVFGYNHERFLKAKSRKDTVHQGPSVIELEDPGKSIRKDLSLNGDGINFFRSASRFAIHFNGICRRFKYVPQMVDLHYDFNQVFAEGSYGVLIQQKRLDGARIKTARGSKEIIVPLPINFHAVDPTLHEALVSVERAYRMGLEQKEKYVIFV